MEMLRAKQRLDASLLLFTGLSCSLLAAPYCWCQEEAPRRPLVAESHSAPLPSNHGFCSASWISGRAR